MQEQSTSPAPIPHVAYYRVSTQRQGDSGLGLEAQRRDVERYVERVGGVIVAEYREIESGRKNKRPMLRAAIADAKVRNARLVIAKLDRLSRNAEFTMGLRNSKVDFVAADMPDANTFTIGLLALIAQDEAERIRTRVRSALAVAKSRGVKLGAPQHLTQEARRMGNEANRAAADTVERRQAANLARIHRDQGMTLREIADQLNALAYKTARGGSWHPTSVNRLLALSQDSIGS